MSASHAFLPLRLSKRLSCLQNVLQCYTIFELGNENHMRVRPPNTGKCVKLGLCVVCSILYLQTFNKAGDASNVHTEKFSELFIERSNLVHDRILGAYFRVRPGCSSICRMFVYSPIQGIKLRFRLIWAEMRVCRPCKWISFCLLNNTSSGSNNNINSSGDDDDEAESVTAWLISYSSNLLMF